MGSSLRDERSGRWRQRILLPSAKAGHVTRPGAETAELGRTAEMRGTAEMREPAGLGEAMKAAGAVAETGDATDGVAVAIGAIIEAWSIVGRGAGARYDTTVTRRMYVEGLAGSS